MFKRSNFFLICKLRNYVNRNLELERVYPSKPFRPVQMLAAKAGAYIRREHLEGAPWVGFGHTHKPGNTKGGKVSLYH